MRLSQSLNKLTPITGGDLRRVLTIERLQALQDAVLGLAAGENITTSGGLKKGLGDGKLRLDVKAVKGWHAARGRFICTFHGELQAFIITPGAVARVDFLKPDAVTPEFPLVDGEVLDEPRKLYLDAETAGQEYELFLELDDEDQIVLRETGSDDGDGTPGLVLATVTFKAASGGEGLAVDAFEQLWESDVVWPAEESSSSSGSGSSSEESSSGSASSGSSSGSGGGSSGSGGSGSSGGGSSGGGSSGGGDSSGGGGSSGGGPSGGSGSDKSTAIVPASWLAAGFTALFTEEAPDVRFHDVMRVEITGRVTRVEIDPRYLEVCEPGTILVQGVVADRPQAIGAKVCGPAVILECGWWRRPGTVVVNLTGIRKGFAGLRFPARTREQFVANEAFINSAYPGRKEGRS